MLNKGSDEVTCRICVDGKEMTAWCTIYWSVYDDGIDREIEEIDIDYIEDLKEGEPVKPTFAIEDAVNEAIDRYDFHVREV